MRIAALALCLVVAGCNQDSGIRINARSDNEATPAGVLRVVAAQCPQSLGVLTMRGAPTADGLMCTYGGPRGAEVVLRLTPLNGREADAILSELEAGLQAEAPETLARVAPSTPAAGEEDPAAPGINVQADGDTAKVRLPGISIDADGSNARVSIGGMNIVADDGSERVETHGDDDSFQIRALDDAAEIRTRSAGGGVRATYLLVDESASAAGWRLLGFEARGPGSGPLVVAIVRGKDRREDELFDAARSLVTLNVGD